MLPAPHRTEAFPNGALLAQALASAVADALMAGVEQRGVATVALSGGRTPAAFLEALFGMDLPWSRVQLTLVDDRCVPHASERSNVRLVETARRATPAVAAPFIPLTDPTSGAPLLDTDLPATLEVVVLGMGTDGHTASLFPDGDHLAIALDSGAPRLLTMTAPGAPEPRVTLSLPAILSAGSLFLHTEGVAKHVTLRTALGPGALAAMPVRGVLRQSERPVTLFTHPDPGPPA